MYDVLAMKKKNLSLHLQGSPSKKTKTKKKRAISLRTGFEPVRGDPIGFQVQRLNHSAIAARDLYKFTINLIMSIRNT